MNKIERRRFEALAGYIRSPWSAVFALELAWFEEEAEKLLGVVSLDTVDGEFVATALARDAKNRFRAVGLKIDLPTQYHAEAWLEEELSTLVTAPPESFFQGDETGARIDFFTPIVAEERLSPAFRRLTDNGYSPALGLLSELMHHFVDVDGNFVQQFQSAGFDARLWELYLYALFTELGYGLKRDAPVPDFHCIGLGGEFLVEATTVNASDEPLSADDLDSAEYFKSYVPMKFGSALFSKLQKRYWEKPHVQGKPLMLAIQDFHARGSMTWSNSALVEYLYGVRQTEVTDADGTTRMNIQTVEKYEWKGKVVPAGFFTQPGAENISAVLANPGGTITKFNRMGFLAGFGDRRVRMYRRGLAYRGGRTSQETFTAEVHAPGYEEFWWEGLSVYHNPNAKVALPHETLPTAAHHTLENGRIVTSVRVPFYPLGSQTLILGIEQEP